MGIDLALFGQRVRLINWLGAAIGIPGVALLLFDGRSGVPVITFHLALLFGAVFFWSLGTSLSKRMTLPRDTLLNSGIQMSVAGVVSLFVAQIQQPVQSVAWQAVSPGSWVGVAFLAVIGSLAYCSFAYLCAHEPNYRIVTYALVNPLIAVYIGLYIGSETMVPYLFPGMGAILTGLFLMFYGERLTEWAVRRNQES
jgi:drug/metabolite transporter (DMT)-like permease